MIVHPRVREQITLLSDSELARAHGALHRGRRRANDPTIVAVLHYVQGELAARAAVNWDVGQASRPAKRQRRGLW